MSDILADFARLPQWENAGAFLLIPLSCRLTYHWQVFSLGEETGLLTFFNIFGKMNVLLVELNYMLILIILYDQKKMYSNVFSFTHECNW